MPESSYTGGGRLRGRRWTFADCVFDESNWTLVVDGRRVAIETKPLELLRELLLRAGNVVTKDELLDKIWPDVTVVEASLPTAVHKLRHVLGEERGRHVIETVSGIGYRVGGPVSVEDLAQPAQPVAGPATMEGAPASRAHSPVHWRMALPARLALALAGLSIGGAAVVMAVSPPAYVAAANTERTYTQRDAANALRKLDVGTVEDMLAAGWDPNKPFDKEDNAAINFVLGMCEWDRGHNQEQMVLLVRTLIDGGAKLDHRNVWGDTPYSIAKAVRYCGPNHPVTRSIREMCFAGYKPYGNRCLASYELTRS